MSLLANLRKKQSERFATATPATFATLDEEEGRTVATVATVTVAKPIDAKPIASEIVGADDTAEPFDREAFEERAAICEFDSELSREDAETIAWHEDDRRRCAHCLNLLSVGICKIATPGGLVSATKRYRPDQNTLQRCAGYRPCPDDPDRRLGEERWPGLVDVAK